MDKNKLWVKKNLFEDFGKLKRLQLKKGYLFTLDDAFALGYLCGKYNLNRITAEKKKLVEACNIYDETDDLMLLDTIKETLIDLKII